jgi:CubicO group peptidase (beta-lactamase class C family)
MRFPITVLLACAVFACSAPEKKQRTTLAERIDALMDTMDRFSGVVLVAKEGNPLYHRAFGYSDYRLQVAMDTAAIFELASVSKQFTAMIIMMLADEGRLTYDDPLARYIGGLPYTGITVRNLLNHTSGLPDYQALMDKEWDKSRAAGNEDIIAYLIRFRPPALFVPGERYEYSNTGYVLLGTVAEVASGEDFTGLCRRKIFQPLGMVDTDLRTPDEKRSLSRMTRGHIWSDEKRRFVQADSFPSSDYTLWLGRREGPGRISSTASDLLKWDVALNSGQVASEAAFAEAYEPAVLNDGTLSNYGFGWHLDTADSLGRKIWHDGDNPGYRTRNIRYVDAGFDVILLSNNNRPHLNALVKAIEAVLGETE